MREIVVTDLTLAGHPDLVDWQSFSPADWDLLIATARTQGVAPLLYHALNTYPERGRRAAGWPESMPAHTHRELQAAYYATAARNLLLYQELAHILAALRVSLSPLLPVILLKGAALATSVYPRTELRPMRDLDLLVPHQHLATAVQAVQSLEYREVYPEMTPGLNRVAGHCVHMRGGPQRSVAVELHWGLVAGDTDWRSPPLDWFWTQTEKWKMDNGGRERENEAQPPTFSLQPPISNPKSEIRNPKSEILTLTPTAHLLYLAAHLMLQHGGAQARLLWFYDLHLLVSRCENRLDWDELLARARLFRWAAALHAALRGTQDRFDTPLPHGFLDALAETRDPQATRMVERKAGLPRTRATNVWHALTSLDWRTRLRLAWGLACPSPTYMRWRYNPWPAWLWSVYYPYRWFDIVRDGLSTLWRLVRGRVADKVTR
ncbi:MAG: nucleotidyltransferase family protein [Anaerolineae bacterium]